MYVWTATIRIKKKYDRTPENFELRKRYRGMATRERRKALSAYWYKKSKEMKSKQHDFFDTFLPFLANKTKDASVLEFGASVFEFGASVLEFGVNNLNLV